MQPRAISAITTRLSECEEQIRSYDQVRPSARWPSIQSGSRTPIELGGSEPDLRVRAERQAQGAGLPDRRSVREKTSARSRFPVAAIADEARAGTGAPLYSIFHSSFCCSTLLAKALELSKVAAASLSEPNVLVNLAEHGNSVRRCRHSAEVLELGLRLTGETAWQSRGRHPQATRASRTGSFNPFCDLRSGSRGVLLYSDAAKHSSDRWSGAACCGRINARKLYQNSWPNWSLARLWIFRRLKSSSRPICKSRGSAWLAANLPFR